jgi:hypothetical protein
MSARVFNPVVMSEMRRMLRGAGAVPESGVQSPTAVAAVGTLHRPDGAAIVRVRRALFGPVDHEDTRRFVDQELASQQARDAERWGFDFVRERERNSGPGTKRYIWEKVTPEDKVPESYALRGMKYLSKCAIHGEVVAATSAPATTSTKQTRISGKLPPVQYMSASYAGNMNWNLKGVGWGGTCKASRCLFSGVTKRRCSRTVLHFMNLMMKTSFFAQDDNR